MSNEDFPTPSPSTSSQPRRASFSPGQTISELFNRSASTNNSGTSAYPGTIASAAAQAQTRRRMSISTVGLSGTSPTQTSPWSATSMAGHRTSFSSAGTGSSAIDENAIEEGDAISMPSTPFGRRMSFGAKAMQTVRGSAGAGKSPSGAGSPTGKARGVSSSSAYSSSPSVAPHFHYPKHSSDASRRSTEGFNWSESLRSRAESSLERGAGSLSSAGAAPIQHGRAQSVATVTTPVQPPQELAKSFKPDPFQERILKGDFYMD
jgi:hypothetical protein